MHVRSSNIFFTHKIEMCMKLFLVLCVCCLGLGNFENPSEPFCLSKFDYDYKVLAKLVELENQLNKIQDDATAEKNSVKREFMELSALFQNTRRTVDDVAQKVGAIDKNRSQNPGGSSYVRWGRRSCPGNGTLLVYVGYSAGSHRSHTGAAANYLCMPEDPLWSKFNADVDENRALVYGVEFETEGPTKSDPFDDFVEKTDDKDLPCCTCLSKRSTVMMIPGRNQRYDGWTLEYHGYLVTGLYTDKAASEYACFEANPDIGQTGNVNNNEHWVFFTEARCGSLPCPPYVNGRELACVVCSK